MNDIGMDLVTLGGALPGKLDAIQAAGFTQVMLKGPDVTTLPGGVPEAVRHLQNSGLRCTGLQVLRDFEGVAGRFQAFKCRVAREMLAVCTALNCKTLLACSSTTPHARKNLQTIVRDLRLLATIAADYEIRIAYEALSWGHTVNETKSAWQIVTEVDHYNLGVALDSFHHIATYGTTEQLAVLHPDKIFLVQLSDFLPPDLESNEERMATARHYRVFPGEGSHDEELGSFISTLGQIGYRGDYSLEVFNDDYVHLPLSFVVQRAKESARWIKARDNQSAERESSQAA